MTDLKALRDAAYAAAAAPRNNTVRFDVELELKELVRLGACSKATAKRALSKVDAYPFDNTGLSVSEYVDMLVELAGVR